MSRTTIEWTRRPGTSPEVWNPTTGCNKVDRGCKHCYAEAMHKRLTAMGQPKYAKPFLEGAQMHHEVLNLPFTWRTPRTVFVDSMSDLFHDKVEHSFLERAFKTMRSTPQHTYLILTKRPERALHFQAVRRCAQASWTWPPNVWLGTSAHDQASAEGRVPTLLNLDVRVRFLSAEPLLGPIDLTRLVRQRQERPAPDVSIDALLGWHGGAHQGERTRLEWVICGGESGARAEPMDPAWPRYLRDQCHAAGTPFFFKQWVPTSP